MKTIKSQWGAIPALVIGIVALVSLLGGWFFYSSRNSAVSDNEENEIQYNSTAMGEGNNETTSAGGAMTEKTEPTANQNGIPAETRVFAITGQNFAFSQQSIRVKKGGRVKIEFESKNGFHDWTIDEFNARTARINTGGTSSVEFTADKTGEFEFYCSVGSHRQMGMTGKLIVE